MAFIRTEEGKWINTDYVQWIDLLIQPNSSFQIVANMNKIPIVIVSNLAFIDGKEFMMELLEEINETNKPAKRRRDEQ